VIFASDGAASHPHSATHTPSHLRALRKEEASAAVLTLAPHATVEFLELPDGELAANGAPLRSALRETCWDETLLLAPWAYDRHPDHEACARAARAVATDLPQVELMEFPIWAWRWGVPAENLARLDPRVAGTRRLTLDPDLRKQKQAAIACYPSQTGPLSAAPGDEAVLTAESLAHFERDCECFFLIAPSGV
jgi:LmbE family N-acetylglucosaminyl deacetylase